MGGISPASDFEAVRQPDAKMVAVGRQENLRLVTQPAETDRMDDPIAIALEGVARAARLLSFAMKAAAAGIGVRGPGRRRHARRRFICASIRSEEHTSELQSLMSISYAVFCLKNKIKNKS